ncbi:HNH endonuclease [candidate division KSB1 bacterium]|nr:HNH endonuclease [candidate division KSB1 bacterium]
MAKKKPFSQIHYYILDALQNNPEGLDIEEIREQIPLDNIQQHLDRRVRDLYPYYIIIGKWQGKRYIYQYIGERPESEWEDKKISKTLRAQILTRDGRRCQMCGKTVTEDNIKLHVDHKIPRSWGGKTEESNLWALCSTCNEGKKNYFSSFDTELMKKVMTYESVHDRIAYLLRQKFNEWVDCDLIEFVANFNDYQTDWRKRLRELRYFGLTIESTRKRAEKRSKSYYKLTNWVDLPDDSSKAAREYERNRAKRNKLKKSKKNQTSED